MSASPKPPRKIPHKRRVNGVIVSVTEKYVRPRPEPGWGDRLAWLLSWIPFVGRLSGCGGCKRRRQKLNRVGRWVAKWRRRLFAR